MTKRNKYRTTSDANASFNTSSRTESEPQMNQDKGTTVVLQHYRQFNVVLRAVTRGYAVSKTEIGTYLAFCGYLFCWKNFLFLSATYFSQNCAGKNLSRLNYDS